MLYLYKRIIKCALTCAAFYMSGSLYAQNKPNGSLPLVATPIAPPAAYTNANPNYIRTWYPRVPLTNMADVTSATRPASDVAQRTIYLDQVGRPIQLVTRAASPLGFDYVLPMIYDKSDGLQHYQYLPYTAGRKDGVFNPNAFSDQYNALRQIYPLENIFYSQTIFEQAVDPKPVSVTGPGNTYVANGKGKQLAYQYNDATDQVARMRLNAITGLPERDSMYHPGELMKNVTTDEQGFRRIEFTDVKGHTVAIWSELSKDNGTAELIYTYLVYDQLGRLRYVIPPYLGASIWGNLTANAVISGTFSYKYSGDGKLVSLQEPGSLYSNEWVYDQRGRVAFKRDANLQDKKKWIACFYDELNRVVMTAIYNRDVSREILQAEIDGVVPGARKTVNFTIPVNDVIRDQYGAEIKIEAKQSITLVEPFETAAGSELEVVINPSVADQSVPVTITEALLNINPALLTPLTYTYYDSYDFPGAAPLSTTEQVATGSARVNTTGFNTGIRVRVTGTDQWLTTTYYYDEKAQVKQVTSENVNGGKDVVSYELDYMGHPLHASLRQINPKSTGNSTLRLLTTFDYDGAGRLLRIHKKVNDAADKITGTYTYNENGQLKDRSLGDGLETLNYEYTLRGRLKSINKDYVHGGTNHYFGEELFYEYGYDQNQYGGNLSGVNWRGYVDKEVRSYGFIYDGLSRMLKAEFAQQYGSEWKNDAIDYSVTMGDGLHPNSAYDRNGNILAMTQIGQKAGARATIDLLSYAYNEGHNHLLGVTDAANDANSKMGDFIELDGSGTNDYDYDANGNVIADRNKRILSVTYNYLSQPEKIIFAGNNEIDFLYDAGGQKLRKTIIDKSTGATKTTIEDYMGKVVYINNELQYFAHEEGRVRRVAAIGAENWYMDYFIKDHQGNIRSVLTDQPNAQTYAATMETENAALETQLFSDVDASRVAKPVGYPQDNTTTKNAYVARLNGGENGQKKGPSIVLKVMAGDTIIFGSKGFYKSIAGNKKTTNALLGSVLSSALQSFSGIQQPDAVHAAGSNANTNATSQTLSTDEMDVLRTKDRATPAVNRIRAYINFQLVDEQFKLVQNNAGVVQLRATPDELQELGTGKMVMEKSGYLYIYPSNETSQDIYFDNLVVNFTAGRLLEESHYYPFGEKMFGITSRALAGVFSNKINFSGKELQSEEFVSSNGDKSGLNWYDFGTRQYDPQIGRWLSPDPASAIRPDLTPYRYGFNNPVNVTDPSGLAEWQSDDWYSLNGQYFFNPLVNQENIQSLIPNGKWAGNDFYAADPNSDMLLHYKSDGSSVIAAFSLGEVIVKGTPSQKIKDEKPAHFSTEGFFTTKYTTPMDGYDDYAMGKAVDEVKGKVKDVVTDKARKFGGYYNFWKLRKFVGDAVRITDIYGDVSDMAENANKGAEANLPLEQMPGIGELVKVMGYHIDNVVSENDAIFLKQAASEGYASFARELNNSPGARAGLRGGYATKAVFDQIKANGGFDLNGSKPPLAFIGRPYPELPPSPNGVTYDYFIFFSNESTGVVKNYGYVEIDHSVNKY